MKKFFFIFDKTPKAIKVKKDILKKFKNCSVNESDVIVVGGGDGFLLHKIKKFYQYNKPFYGINCGTFGFLLNKYKDNKIDSRVLTSKKIYIKPLQVQIITNNKKINLLAINEISLLRQSKQTAQLQIKLNKSILLKKLIGDGLLVSSPAGSTAYNLSINGPILSLNSKKLAITPISPFRPRRWKGKIVSEKSTVSIFNLNPKKRPVSSLADNIEIRHIKSVKVQTSKKNPICLLYDKDKSLDKRIKFEQLIKKN